MYFLRKCLLSIALFLTVISQVHADFNGKVIKVIDGDTVDILTPKKQKIRVRLLDIDAPESQQEIGRAHV